MQIIHLTPRQARYQRYMNMLAAAPLRTQWWDDAESEVDPDVSYLMVLAADAVGDMVPAAWAGYALEQHESGAVLRCCNNYVRREFRGRNPDLYAEAYHARHNIIVSRLQFPAVTYLFEQPIQLHEADGWVKDTSPDGHGVSDLGHPWWRLRRFPTAAPAVP
jgi:hypothetical protein